MPSVTIDPSTHNRAKPAISPDDLVPISQEKLEELENVFGFKLHADAKALNGEEGGEGRERRREGRMKGRMKWKKKGRVKERR